MYEDHVRCGDVVVADQIVVALQQHVVVVVVVVVLIVVVGWRRRWWRRQYMFDVDYLGACLSSGVAAVGAAVRFFFHHVFLHLAVIWDVCSHHLDLVFVCLIVFKKKMWI